MIEILIAHLIMNCKQASILLTDAYKFSMAQAGFPLRRETFYLSFRKPGFYYIPFDLATVVKQFIPRLPNTLEASFLTANGYGLTPAMEKAIKQDVEISAAPKGSWVYGREPILTITGPSFLVSWLEPLVIMLRFPIQVATEAMLHDRRKYDATCETEAEIIRQTYQAIGKNVPVEIEVDTEHYRTEVRRKVKALIAAVKGDAHRLFEVGMRAATCMQMHAIAVEECQKAGMKKTSNVQMAYDLYMIPVGTTGHEHQQRWGEDGLAYRAVRDCRPQPPSYLPDTFETMLLGIPVAIEVIREDPNRSCTVRFDNRDEQDEQLERFIQAMVYPTYIFEDSYDEERTLQNEAFCEELNLDPEDRHYGYGSHIVGWSKHDLTRNQVSAVYKLTQTGPRPVMKHSETGKESVPGKPIIFRRVPGTSTSLEYAECGGLIGQEGEEPPPGFSRLLSKTCRFPTPGDYKARPVVGLSARTKTMVDSLKRERQARIDAAKETVA